MNEWAALVTALTLGLVSSAHCVGMCGGIMGALTLAVPAAERGRRWRLLLGYNLGRISSYAFMGLVVGAFAGFLGGWGAGLGLRVLAGLLLIATGLYLGDWWRGITYLEHGGRYLWAYLQPLGKGLLPVTRVYKALLLGLLWGWLPCGLVYTALAYAMTLGHPGWSAAVMLAFGLGTLPAVLATGFFAQRITGLLQRHQLRRGIALLIIAFGVWTLLVGAQGHQHPSPGPSTVGPQEHHH